VTCSTYRRGGKYVALGEKSEGKIFADLDVDGILSLDMTAE